MVTNNQVRELLTRHGECCAQDSSDWSADIQLPTPIAEFYKSIGPQDISIESIGLTFSLPALSNLWDAQTGYRSHPQTGEPLASWGADWIVVADAEEEPLPFLFSNGRILACCSDDEGWKTHELLPDLNSLSAALATLGDVVMESAGELTDEDFNVNPDILADAHDRLVQILTDAKVVSRFLQTVGWC